MTVVRDQPGLIGLYLPIGTVYARRTGTRGGPGGRMLVEWDGGYSERTWVDRRVLILHRPGRAHTVQLLWDADDRLVMWYVNAEAPWRRSPIGFDTYEHVLDAVIDSARTTFEWKDEEELAWKVSRGEISPVEAAAIRAELAGAISDVLGGEPPWTNDWEQWRPDPRWTRPCLPTGWTEARA